jgi:hypothetical protein
MNVLQHDGGGGGLGFSQAINIQNQDDAEDR